MTTFFSTLKGRLLLLIGAALIPAIGLILYTVWQSYENELANVRSKVLGLAKASQLEGNIKTEGARQLLSALAVNPELFSTSHETCHQKLSYLLKNNASYVNFGAVDLNGDIFCSALPQKTRLNISEVGWYQRVKASHAATVSSVHLGKLSGKPVQVTGYPVFDTSGQLKLVIFAALSMDYLSRIQGEGSLPENSEILAFDHDGTLLQLSPDRNNLTSTTLPEHPLIQPVIHSSLENSTAEVAGIDGHVRFYGFVRLGQQGQHSYIAVGIPKSYAYAGINKILLYSFAGLLLVSVIVLTIAWLGSTLIAGKINTLVQVSRRFGAGNLAERTGLPHDTSEIGRLAHSFDDMADTLQQRQLELQSQKFAMDQHAIVSIADTAGFILYANDKLCEISGYTRQELIGRNHNILNSGLHDKQFFRDLWKTIHAGKVWQGEIRNVKKQGGYYWVRSTIVPFLDAQGLPYQYISIRTDITRFKELEAELQDANTTLLQRVEERTAELSAAKDQLELDILEKIRADNEQKIVITQLQETNKKLEEAQNQLLQSEKMATIGQLAAGVAHEINNPIGYVYSNLGSLNTYMNNLFDVLDAYGKLEAEITDAAILETLRKITAQADLDFLKQDLAELMKESREGIVRVKEIVQNLKDFSHVDSSDTWHFSDIQKGLNSTLNIVLNELKYKCEIRKEYGDIPEIECLPSQLNQVFLNLLVNAGHAIEEQGTITLSTGQAEGLVWIEVADSGKGIQPENLKRIFDPFFTTKPIGKGTGLGLSLSYSIVQKHHGRIEVHSEVGKGTSFRVWLPCTQPERIENGTPTR